MEQILVGGFSEDIAAPLKAHVYRCADLSCARFDEVEDILSQLGGRSPTVEVLVLGGGVDEPVPVAQRAHSIDEDLSIVIVAAPDGDHALAEAFQFSPFLGPEVAWMPATSVQRIADAVVAAAATTRRRRSFRAMLDSVQPLAKPTSPWAARPSAYLDELLDLAPVGVILCDRNARVLALNRHARWLLDVSEEEQVGQPLTRQFAQPDAQRLAGVLEGFAGVTSGTTTTVFERLRADGTVQNLELTVGRIAAETAADRLMVIMQNVSELYRAQERQTLLLRELDHRVKNNLSWVLAIAEQTVAHSGSLDDFQAAFVGRIRAMAKVHEALALSNWQDVQLDEMIRALLSIHGEPGDGRCMIAGEPVALSSMDAAPLGMMFHELATNALKYGALSDTEGCVTVSWTLGPERRLRLVWRETGGPRVRSPTRRGFGSKLLEELIEYELSGTVKLDFDSDGVVCVVEVPLG